MQDFFLIYSKDKNQNEAIEHFISKGKAFFQKSFYSDFKVVNQNNVMGLLAARSNDDSNMRTFEDNDMFFAWKGGWFYLDRVNNPDKNPAVFLREYTSDVNRSEYIENIDGVFNFIVLEKKSAKITVITDRLGIAPLYYRKIKGLELISSSCMLLASLHDTELDYTGVMEFIFTGKHFEDRTIFQDIKKMKPASVYEFCHKENKIIQYWDMHYGVRDHKLSSNDKVELLQYEMGKIDKGISSIYSNPYIDLTGGWDSRVNILSLNNSVSNMVTTTSGFNSDNDVVIAKQIAEILGLEHNQSTPYLSSSNFSEEHYIDLLEKSIFITDGCMSAPLYTHTLNTQKTNKKMGCDVTINGSGGELYRQYWWEPSYFIYSDFKNFNFTITGKSQFFNEYQLAKRVITQNSLSSIFDKTFPVNIYKHLYDLFEKLNEPYGKICNIDQISNVYLNYRMKNWLAGYYSATLRMNDCLSPLLMKGPLKVSMELSFKDKLFNSFLRKYITERNFTVSNLDLETHAPTLPVSFKNLNRFAPAVGLTFSKTLKKVIEKTGFTALQSGKQIKNVPENPNLETVRKILSLNPEKMKLMNIFNKTELKKFISGYQNNAAFPYKEQYENIFTIEAILERIAL